MTIRFLQRPLIEYLHRRQLERFGGASGLREAGALEPALARPLNKAAYGCDDLTELAAAYLYGLAKSHAFVDGNKRIAIVAAGVFLMDNGYQIAVDDARCMNSCSALPPARSTKTGRRASCATSPSPWPSAREPRSRP